jgi:hypothetical protein
VWQSATPKRPIDDISSGGDGQTLPQSVSTPKAKIAHVAVKKLALPTSGDKPTEDALTASFLKTALLTPRTAVRANVQVLSELQLVIVRGGATLNHLDVAVAKPLATMHWSLGDGGELRGLRTLFAQLKVLAAGYTRVGAKLADLKDTGAALELVRRFLDLFREPMSRWVSTLTDTREALQALYRYAETHPSAFPSLAKHDDGSLADLSLSSHVMLPLKLLRALSEVVVDHQSLGADEAAQAKSVLELLAAIRADLRQAVETSVPASTTTTTTTTTNTTMPASPQTPKSKLASSSTLMRAAPLSERRAPRGTPATAAKVSSVRFVPTHSQSPALRAVPPPFSPDSPPPPPPPTTPLTLLRGTLKRARTPLSPLFDANGRHVSLDDVESCIQPQ